MLKHSYKISILSLALIVLLSGCEGVKPEASYPDRQPGNDKIIYSDQKRETIWGEDDPLGKKLFGDADEDSTGGAGIGVNSYLWRASLNTISFMPIASADPFGGVIITDWYENPETKGERFKLNIFILDKMLRADGIKVSAFKQELDDKGTWRDVNVPKDMALKIENAILTSAREFRINQLGVAKTN
jgi:hypothetical protein